MFSCIQYVKQYSVHHKTTQVIKSSGSLLIRKHPSTPHLPGLHVKDKRCLHVYQIRLDVVQPHTSNTISVTKVPIPPGRFDVIYIVVVGILPSNTGSTKSMLMGQKFPDFNKSGSLHLKNIMAYIQSDYNQETKLRLRQKNILLFKGRHGIWRGFFSQCIKPFILLIVSLYRHTHIDYCELCRLKLSNIK